MPGKDDPLGQRATLWLDRDANEIARQRYFRAWLEQSGLPIESPGQVAMLNKQWEMAWAAAVAVHSFIAEGRLGPPVDDSPPAS